MIKLMILAPALLAMTSIGYSLSHVNTKDIVAAFSPALGFERARPQHTIITGEVLASAKIQQAFWRDNHK